MNVSDRPPFLASAPLLPVTLAFVAGIIVGRVDFALIVGATAGSVAILFALFRRYHLAALMVAFAIGVLDFVVADTQEDATAFADKPLYYEAIVSDASESDVAQSATVMITDYSVDSLNYKASPRVEARITLPDFSTMLVAGNKIRFRATFQKVKPFTDLPDEIDPAEYLVDMGIFIHAIIKPDDLLSQELSGDVWSRLIRLREGLSERIYRSSLSTPAKEFVNTALLGDAGELSSDTRQMFSASGLSHILALSGLHVGIIAMLLAVALWPLRISGHRNWVGVLTILLLWGYAAMTGLGAPVTRAVVMATIYLTGQMLQRRTSPVNSLCAAALIILLFDPQSLATPGFQLSFSAVLAIIFFADILNPVPESRKTARMICSYIAISVAAMIGTAPIAAFYFHTMPVYFVIANIAAAILLPFLLGGAIVLVVAECFGFDPIWLCWIINHLYGALIWVADAVASLPGAVISHIYFPVGVLVGYFVSVAMLYFWIVKRKLLYGCMFCGALVLTVGLAMFSPAVERSPRLYIARSGYHTDFVIDNGTPRLDIVTTAVHEPLAVEWRSQMRYADYMGRRGIDSIRVVTDDSFFAPGYRVDNNVISFGGKLLTIVASPKVEHRGRTDYAVVCRGYKGDIVEVVEALRPDTVILSYDLHPERFAKYVDECRRLSQPCVSMRECPWSLDY